MDVFFSLRRIRRGHFSCGEEEGFSFDVLSTGRAEGEAVESGRGRREGDERRSGIRSSVVSKDVSSVG